LLHNVYTLPVLFFVNIQLFTSVFSDNEMYLLLRSGNKNGRGYYYYEVSLPTLCNFELTSAEASLSSQLFALV